MKGHTMRNLLRENAKYAFDEDRADRFIDRSMEVQRLHADMDVDFISKARSLAKETGCSVDTSLIVTALRSIGFDNELKIFNAPYDLEVK